MPDSPALKVIPAPQRGRPFAEGNPGRKPGSKNRTTVVAAALLDSEAEMLVRKAVELAKAGDVPMLKFLLGRILPRERPIELDLPPMNFATMQWPRSPASWLLWRRAGSAPTREHH
jgi:hypothetical protein